MEGVDVHVGAMMQSLQSDVAASTSRHSPDKLLLELERGCKLAELANVAVNADSRRDATAAAIEIYKDSAKRLPALPSTKNQRDALFALLGLLRDRLLMTGNWGFCLRSLFER
jgi:hypothetical protein